MARVEGADELYGLPLDEFVAARTALAKRLRQEGRADDAAEVGGLRKPSLALWAVNAAARRYPDEVMRLLDAAEQVRGGEAVGDRELRRAVGDLVQAASELLEEAGHAASDATLQRAATTLQAAASSAGNERDSLSRGALRRELEPAGFEAMAALAGKAPKPRPRPGAPARLDREAERRRERVAEAEAALAEARSRERELSSDAKRAEREAERARRAADAAAADVEQAERALTQAREGARA